MSAEVFPNYRPILEKIVEASMTIPGESGMATVIAALNALGWEKGDELAFRIVPALILSFYDELSAKLLTETPACDVPVTSHRVSQKIVDEVNRRLLGTEL